MKRSHENINIQDELDLLALFHSLWRRKLFIVLMGLTTMLITTIYFSFKKPIYQAKVSLIAPIAADIAALNLGRSYTGNLKPIVPADAYTILRGALLADSTLQFFYKNNKLKNNPKIFITSKPMVGGYTITSEGTSKKIAFDALKIYISIVERVAVEKLTTAVRKELNEVELHIKREIKETREAEIKQQQEQLTHLKEALQIAEAIDLKLPRSLGDHSMYAYLNNPAYLRGSQALAAEIKNIETHSFSESFNEKLNQLEEQYNLIKKLKKDNPNITVSRMDGEIVLNTSSLADKKILILLSGILGCLFGCFILMLRQLKIIETKV